MIFFTLEQALKIFLTCSHKKCFCDWIKYKSRNTEVFEAGIYHVVALRCHGEEKKILIFKSFGDFFGVWISEAENFWCVHFELEEDFNFLKSFIDSVTTWQEYQQLWGGRWRGFRRKRKSKKIKMYEICMEL